MNRIARRGGRLRVIVLGQALGLVAATASAQVLEETIVTATKRQESMQDVPISVAAMTGEAIEKSGITRMEEFTNQLPAVTVAQNPIGNFIFIRGIGAGPNQGIEQSVSIFHDGIYMGRHQLARAPFMDLARVEVLRGPQSILFGKNTIGGAINVISAKPTDEFEASVSALYGWEENEQEWRGVVSGPLTENLRARLALRSYETEGYLQNTLTAEDGPQRDDWTARLQLQWDASENVSVGLRYEVSEFDSDQQPTQLSLVNPLTPEAQQISGLNSLLVGGLEQYDDRRAVANDGGELLASMLPQFQGVPGFPDGRDGSTNELELAGLTVDWALGEHTFTAVAGYAGYEYRDVCDCDFTALPMILVDGTEDYEQWSLELRLASPVGERFEYITGVYYHDADLVYRSDEAFGTALLGAPNVARNYGLDQAQKQWAVFGSMTWNINERMRSTLGLRYSEENKKASHFLEKRFSGGWSFGGPLTYGDSVAEYDRFEAETTGFGIPAFLDAQLWIGALGTYEHDIRGRERDEEFVSWSWNVEYDLGDSAMLYMSAATGFKGGGFDARFLQASVDDGFEYEDEQTLSVELGVKSTLLDGAVRLNAALFRADVDDLQVSVFDGATGFLVTNAAQMRTQGLEMDLQWAVSENLTAAFSLALLDNEFTEFANSPCWASEQVADPVGCLDGKDVSGSPNLFSPDMAFNVNLAYGRAVTDTVEFRSVLNVNYSDEYFVGADLDPVMTLQDAYTTVDLRLALASESDAWELALLGRNLTDEKIAQIANDQPLAPGNGFRSVDRLRSLALQFSYRW